MTPDDLHSEVVELMHLHSLPPSFKKHYTHADVVDRLWYLAARTYNEYLDDKRAARKATA